MVYTIGLTGDNTIIRTNEMLLPQHVTESLSGPEIWRDEEIANDQLLGSIYSFLADKR